MRALDLALRAGFLLGAAVLVSIAYVAYSTGHLVSPVRLVLYFALPLVLAVTLAVAVFRSSSLRLTLAVNLAVVLACLIGFEMYLQFNAKFGSSSVGNSRVVRDIDLTPQTCAVSSPKTGLRVPGGEPIIPFGGLADREIAWKGYFLTTDRHGFKNPDRVWDDTEGSILVVGDSFTYGGNAAPDRGFVEVLRSKGYPTINLGCGGNGPLSELGTLVEYLPESEIDWIVWVYYEGNDLTKDIVRELESPILSNYLLADFSQGLIEKRPAIETALSQLIEEKREALRRKRDREVDKPKRWSWRDVATLTHLRTRLGLTYGFRANALESFRSILERVASIAEQKGARPLFVYLPGEVRYGAALGGVDAGGYAAAIERVVRDLGFGFVDVDQAFKATGREPLSFFDGHYTDEGHALVADAIAEPLGRSR